MTKKRSLKSRIDPRLFCRKQVLEVGKDEYENEYRVMRRKYMWNISPTERSIEFPHGVYSAIWEDIYDRVPYYPQIQETIVSETLASHRSLEHVLVLGAGGCAIPRFFIGRFKETHVVAVEYSPTICRLAKTYFLEGVDASRLELVCGDAFRFVEQTKQSFDIIFVDLFDEDKLVDGVFDRNFYAQLERILTPQGSVYINAFGLEQTQWETLKPVLDPAFVVRKQTAEHMTFLILQKK